MRLTGRILPGVPRKIPHLRMGYFSFYALGDSNEKCEMFPVKTFLQTVSNPARRTGESCPVYRENILGFCFYITEYHGKHD